MSKQTGKSRSQQGAEGKDKLPQLRAKFGGNPFGPKDNYQGKIFSPTKTGGFDPARFKTQHKG